MVELISRTGELSALLVCIKCQHVLMDTQPGHDTHTPKGLKCDHTNRQSLIWSTWEKTAPEDLEQ